MLHVTHQVNGYRRKLEKLKSHQRFSEMQKIDKWSIWIMEFPV